jgi:hypothetical protein
MTIDVRPRVRARSLRAALLPLPLLAALAACNSTEPPEFEATVRSLAACKALLAGGPRRIADDRADRFIGKVSPEAAECRGGQRALDGIALDLPWVDWRYYWAATDATSRNERYDEGWAARLMGQGFDKLHLHPNLRGIDGALVDLEYERVELIKFNLFDNYTYETYVKGLGGVPGSTVSVWPEMRLPPTHPDFARVGGAAGEQQCSGDLVRNRSLTGICNDVRNPLMGSTGTLFARNVEFTEVFPDRGLTELTRNRHGDRLSLTTPDPQVISRRLFTRAQTKPELCNNGLGLENEDPAANCDYLKAPFFNVLAAYWIQFMTHDWFSHLSEGENGPAPAVSAGCAGSAATGCRENDAYRATRVVDSEPAPTFEHDGKTYAKRAPRTFANNVTAWWDASQIYGYDATSRARVKRDAGDAAKLALAPLEREQRPGDEQGYLTRFAAPCAGATPSGDAAAAGCDTIHPGWVNQETAAFPDNWTIGMSFYHNVFSREHNAFVDAFRRQAAATPSADSGLRNPARPNDVITYAAVTPDELFEAARLVVSAEIAKIHTIEWTTQLLYDEPLYRGMNANWNGLFDDKSDMVQDALAEVVTGLGTRDDVDSANKWYSVLAAGPGIFGLGSKRFEGQSKFSVLTGNATDVWSITNIDHLNGGVNHFGSPFNFPEEFTTVYRLHPLVPDLLELRDLAQPNEIVKKVPAVRAFRAGASDILQRDGLADWALSMGRQRLGLLTLQNHGMFLQNLPLPQRDSPSGMLDIAALDIIRDRERGVPRFNEFRRQYGLRQLTSFEDFVDKTLPLDNAERQRQERLAIALRDVYGQHVCDASK